MPGRSVAVLLSVLMACASASARSLEFTLHRLDSGRSGPTLLVVGGIQGDEPGGFTAASMLVTRYRIDRGSVWVVPNLNFESIIRSSRGIHGDMNRKFSTIDSNDPDFAAVQKIKELILDPRVDLILNLHDGSGFYRPKRINDQLNPRRWGQSIVIDQEAIGGTPVERLDAFARSVVSRVNEKLLDDEHRYRVKNTETRLGDAEMEKTLTYFAIRNGKPAHGVEASKALPLESRVYYHLNVLEAYMDALGIEHRRSFALEQAEIAAEVQRDIRLALYENKILLDVANARGNLRYVPMKRNSPLEFTASNPLVAVVQSSEHFRVSYGNRNVTRLHPQYFDYDDSLEEVTLEVDGAPRRVPIGSVMPVRGEFRVEPRDGYRVNAIGFKRSGVRDESGLTIRREDFRSRFSVDRDAQLFRVEFYRADKFSGMVLVSFGDGEMPRQARSSPIWPDASADDEGRASLPGSPSHHAALTQALLALRGPREAATLHVP